MKITTNHLSALNNLQKMPLVPKNAKVVIGGAPNVSKNMFAHRLAIDLGVPAISMKNLFKNILNTEDYYRSEVFYRRVIDLLKNPNVQEVQLELENNSIPEKLLTLAKYTEFGFVLFDYPNSIKQCEK
jgi:adenylate kinase family enzyme